MKYISNAFSFQMLDTSTGVNLQIVPVSEQEFESVKPVAESVVGHPDTAAVLGVSFNRANLQLKAGDELYVAQLVGGRLPEGSTTLPKGFSFKYLKVTFG
jgi:domain of unknown function (DUF1874)|uniref:DNA binding protein n=1 Tax=Podoviridae sp. ctz6O13 TaxID=2827757 RepID=A0A8S5TJX7_9CAUD|nr:MAG TPA: DNA binding protein [Podoviridae sp. ctz6O13]